MVNPDVHFLQRSWQFVSLQIVISLAFIASIFMSLLVPSAQYVFAGFCLSFILSSFSNLAHITFGRKSPRTFTVLLIINFLFLVTLCSWTIHLLGGK